MNRLEAVTVGIVAVWIVLTTRGVNESSAMSRGSIERRGGETGDVVGELFRVLLVKGEVYVSVLGVRGYWRGFEQTRGYSQQDDMADESVCV